MSGFTHFTLYETNDLASGTPELIAVEWPEVVEFFVEYREHVTDDSSYGSLSNEEFANIVEVLVPVTLVRGRHLDEVGKYFADLTVDPDMRKDSYGYNSFMSFTSHMKVYADLGELNAYKLLVRVMNSMLEDMESDMDNYKYFFHAREINFGPNLTAQNIVNSTIVANPVQLATIVDEKPKVSKAESDFI